jgi:thiol-disulfide isomerase/thioredoxin/sugar lactone lactonase YvrE
MRRVVLLIAWLPLALACDRKTAPPPTSDRPDPATAFLADAGPLASLPPVGERARAGDFAGATAWLNVERPVARNDLDGHVVVVDFWTSACINCLHTLPILTDLERRHGNDGLVVVGVHSPKFDAESEQERLRSAIAENSVGHPVAVDGAMKIWTQWGARAWPTIVVLDTKGRVVWRASGEPKRDELASYVRAALVEGARDGTLKKTAIAGFKLETSDTGPLAFPGKVVALDGGDLAVSDTGHHRIVVLDKTFAVKDVIGTGLAGATDGGFAEASFRKPQGLAQLGDALYVADTENHVIRAIDRTKKLVRTVAGTGEIANAVLRGKRGARETALRSPWDVLAVGGVLYVALAGSHQIAVLDPKDGTIALIAGNGVEARKDGQFEDASFAQPSGLTTDGTSLWVADSETSSVRAISIATRSVTTVVGKDLFVFGDTDGAAEKVRLKHPLGVVHAAVGPKGPRPALWVVDTYNSKIKRVEPATGSTRTVAGTPDHRELFEPSGATALGSDLIITDTKHHRLVRLTLSAEGDGKIEPIAVKGLTAPTRGIAVANVGDAGGSGIPIEKVEIPEVRVRPDGPTKVLVTWSAPPGTGVNEDAPFRVRWNRSDGLVDVPSDVKSAGRAVKDGFSVSVRPMAGAPNASLTGEIDLVICDVATHSICVPVRRSLELGFISVKDASPEAKVTVPLPQAKAP